MFKITERDCHSFEDKVNKDLIILIRVLKYKNTNFMLKDSSIQKF